MTSTLRESLNAILFACFGWFLFCVSDSIAKHLSGSYSIFEILAVMGVLGTLLSALWILIGHGVSGFKTPKLFWYIMRSLTHALSSLLVIKTLSTIPLADFYGVIFMMPMTITLLAAVFLQERIGAYRIFAIVIGFIGVLIIAGPSFASGNIGYLYGLLAVLVGSISSICIRKIGQDNVPARYAFFPFLACALVFVPLCLFTGFTAEHSPFNITLLALLAPVVLLGILCSSLAFSRARDTALITPFHYTQMVWGTIFGFLFFGDIPEISTFAGSCLIIFAGMMVIWREHVLHHKNAVAAFNSPL